MQQETKDFLDFISAVQLAVDIRRDSLRRRQSKIPERDARSTQRIYICYSCQLRLKGDRVDAPVDPRCTVCGKGGKIIS